MISTRSISKHANIRSYFNPILRLVNSKLLLLLSFAQFFVQMAKHVGLIPSLDGGLYQVNGDKVEVTLIYALFLTLFIV